MRQAMGRRASALAETETARRAPARGLEATEAQFQSAVLALARQRGWLVYHAFDSRRGAGAVTLGFPDLVLVRGERVLFAELKTNTGRVALRQRRWLTAVTEAGCETRLWRPRDWARIERELL